MYGLWWKDVYTSIVPSIIRPPGQHLITFSNWRETVAHLLYDSDHVLTCVIAVLFWFIFTLFDGWWTFACLQLTLTKLTASSLFRNLKKGMSREYISGVHFQKSPKSSIIFFTLNIISTIFLTSKRGPRRKGPLNTPLETELAPATNAIFHFITFDKQTRLLVGSFVRLLRFVLSRQLYKSDFHEIWQTCSASAPHFTTKFWEVKVKVQGQNRRSENRLS